MTSPCYNCTDRHPRCHAECGKYLDWAAANEERKMRERPPYTVGCEENHTKYAREAVRQKRYLRHHHEERMKQK